MVTDDLASGRGVQAVDWLAIAPVAIVAATLLIVIAVHALAPRVGRATTIITLVGLAGSGVSLIPIARLGRTVATFCGPDGCSYQTGGHWLGLQAIVLVAAVVTVLASLDQLPADPLGRSEFWVLILAATAGALAVVGARDLFTLLIAVETAALPMVGLVGAERTRQAAGAALRLLLVTVVSFAITVVGIALIYAAVGTVHLTRLAAAPGSVTMLVGVAFVVAGFGYKVAAMPFGIWVADVYPAAPTPVALLLSTTSKVAGVAAALLVVISAAPGLTDSWLPALVAVTMTVGNLVALTRRTAIGLLAWSTVAQAGWALLPLAAVVGTGLATSATITYLLAYCAASLAAFVVVALVARHHPAGRRHAIADQAGLARTEPVAAAVLILALLSLAGLPPGIAGLVAKVAAVQPVVAAGVWWLAVLAAVNVAIGLAYYLRWVWTLVATAPPTTRRLSWQVRPGEGAALSLAAGLLIVFTVLPGIMV